MARSGPGFVTSAPPRVMEPAALGMSPAMASNKVLLPHPLEPTMVTKDPFSMVRDTRSTAVKISSLFGLR